MTERAIEASQSLLALVEAALYQAQVVGQSRLLNECYRQKEAVSAREKLSPAARLIDLVDDAGQEREENPAKDLVLLQQLVLVEAL